jgi:hypothetical protein
MCVKERHYVHVKAACTWLKLCSGSGSRSFPSSLLPHPSDQRTTNKCLPFCPAAPPMFRTWVKHGVTGVMVLTVWAGYCYCTFQKRSMIHYIFSETIVWVDHCYCTFQKYKFTFTIFLRNDHSVNIVGWDEEF